MTRWKPLPGTPGPKRDDPLRKEALRLNGLKQQEFKKRAEHEIKAMLVQVGCRVRVRIEGLAPIQGKVVGESKIKFKHHTTECWLVQNLKHGIRPYAKAHCEKIKPSEASRAVRGIKPISKGPQGPQGPDTIYGDGDI